eukprot:scaffold37054_cov72-Cyclotella_meneghiniana.AAC.5
MYHGGGYQNGAQATNLGFQILRPSYHEALIQCSKFASACVLLIPPREVFTGTISSKILRIHHSPFTIICVLTSYEERGVRCEL